MKALITGGTGFTGTHLVRRLLGRGHEVTVLDSRRTSSCEELKKAGAAVVIGSVTDAELVERTVAGHSHVFHLAAAFRQINAPAGLYSQVNVGGTRNVLRAAERHGVAKVVHCSTAGVHGDRRVMPWHEESPIAPRDEYQRTKWEGEEVCREFLQRGLDITIVRPTSEYGPGDLHGMRFLFRLVRKGRFLMFGDGQATVHPVYIDNLLDLFELVTQTPASRGRSYIAGDESPCTLDHLVREVGRAQGIEVKILHLPLFGALWLCAAAVELACRPLRIPPPLFRRRVNWFRNTRAYRIDRAKAELGYCPRVSLQDGLRRTAEWYREHGYL